MSNYMVGVSPVIAHDFMMREYTAKEEGYVFMYVSNENATLVDVYFSLSRPCGNDVVMPHTKSNVIQYNEYYPFGMNTANSWTQENTTGNNFLYNAGSELNKTTSNYEMFFREYDPALGRVIYDFHKQSIIIGWLILFSLINCTNDTSNLQLELLNQELRIGHTKPKFGKPCINTCVDITFKLNNPTKENYMLYNFLTSPQLATEEDSLHDRKLIFIAGVHVFVYNTFNQQIRSARYISDDINYKAMTSEFMELKQKESREKYRTAKQVIHAGQSFEFVHNINFKDFDLEPGNYQDKLIYSQSPNVTHKVDSSLIKEDEKTHNAKVYIGRFWSNKIKLVVE